MSLIQQALIRAAAQRKAQGAPEERSVAERLSTERPSSERAAAEAAHAVAPLDRSRFQSVSFDRQAMEKNCVMIAVPDDRAAVQAYKILRTRVRQRMAQKRWRTVAVTGVTPGDGKTLTAINLALAMAQDDNSWVYLVDFDLLRPAVAPTLGLKLKHGLSDYLAGGCEANDLVCATEYERLAIVANTAAVPDSTEQLVSRRTLELLETLRADTPSRTIIIDMPPMLGTADVLAFAPHVDCVLAVVSEGETSRESLASAREILGETNLLGTVLNRSTEAESVSYDY